MNDEPQITDLKGVVPPWHRFSLIAHVASNVTAIATAIVLVGITAENFGTGFFSEIWNGLVNAGLAQFLFGLFCLIVVSVSISLPATWISIVIAKRCHLVRYWQFGLLGLVAAIVVPGVFILLAAAGSTTGLVSVLASFGAAFAVLFKIGFYLVPICVAAALTYRAVVGCADHFGCGELP